MCETLFPLLLSQRQAAKLLGINRGHPGLSTLLKRGVLQKVVVDGKEYLSRSQLEEFARVGEAPAPPRKRREKKRGHICDLNLDALDAEF